MVKRRRGKITNPDGMPLRLRDDCELAEFINKILKRGKGFETELPENQLTLLDVSRISGIHYQCLWSAYNRYRKLPLLDMLDLHRIAESTRLEAMEMYLRQPEPIRGLKAEDAPELAAQKVAAESDQAKH